MRHHFGVPEPAVVLGAEDDARRRRPLEELAACLAVLDFEAECELGDDAVGARQQVAVQLSGLSQQKKAVAGGDVVAIVADQAHERGDI